MKGRRPKPKPLKLVAPPAAGAAGGQKTAATTKPRTRKTATPAVAAGAGREPTWLKGEARWLWRQLRELLGPDGENVISALDRTALAVLCNTWREYREAERLIEKYGEVYETVSKEGGRMLRKNPAVEMRADADRRLRAWLTEFGCTPAAVSKVAKQPGENNNPLAALLARRNANA